MRYRIIKESDLDLFYEKKKRAFHPTLRDATHALFVMSFPEGASNLSDSDRIAYDKLYNSIRDVVTEWQKWVDDLNKLELDQFGSDKK